MNINIASLIKNVTIPVHLTIGQTEVNNAVDGHIGDLVLPYPVGDEWRAELAGLLRATADEIENSTSDAARWTPGSPDGTAQ